MAAPKALDPRAPEYIPLSYKTSPYAAPIPLLPSLSTPTPHFCYAASTPIPLSCFPTADASSFHTQPLFTTSYHSHQPPLRHMLPLPSTAQPPLAVVVAAEAEPQEVVTGWVRDGDRRRERRSGRGGKREGKWFSRHHQNEGSWVRRFKVGNGGRDELHGKVESSLVSLLKKHEVLPLRVSEEKTTVMIKNIPKEYTRGLLLKFLDEHCLSENQQIKLEDNTVSAFDFLYLPMDFRTGCSRGFAFVNFTNARAAWKFYNACNRKKWDFFQSPKIREIVCAMIQGKEALIKHFEKSTFYCESDQFLPVCFSPPRDGSGEWVEEHKVGRRIASSTPSI